MNLLLMKTLLLVCMRFMFSETLNLLIFSAEFPGRLYIITNI